MRLPEHCFSLAFKSTLKAEQKATGLRIKHGMTERRGF